MGAYLTTVELRVRTIMPAADFDSLEPAFIASRLSIRSSEIDARLRKRYAAPFGTPFPEVVQGWLVDIVTPDLYFRRGWDPASEQGTAILELAAAARESMKEAADSQNGLYDLPLLGTADTAISKGGPLGYSEASPYTWTDAQVYNGNYGGTYGGFYVPK